MVASAAFPAILTALGVAVVVFALADVFVTVFNYDGYCLLANRVYPVAWRVVRVLARPWPGRSRHTFLSLGSAALVPATVVLWLALEVTGFAFIYRGGFGHGGFSARGLDASFGSAFEISGAAISSLFLGNAVPRAAEAAAMDIETIAGIATFTITLGYVVTAFGLLQSLEHLHGQVRRHATDPERPSSILSRHFRGGSPNEFPSFLQSLGDALEEYDHGLRRYPVVYYFHTRRRHRTIPVVFTTLGDLISLTRWGLPSTESMTDDAFLDALADGFRVTLDRLRQNFAGPDPIELPEPLPQEEFERQYDDGGPDPFVHAFRTLVARATEATGIPDDDSAAARYERYGKWLPFAAMQWKVLDRVAHTLGYATPDPLGRAR